MVEVEPDGRIVLPARVRDQLAGRTITHVVTGLELDEDDETFTVNVGNVSGSFTGTSAGESLTGTSEEDTIQALGGMGYINETPTGRLWRDAKLYEIGAGTSEIRRWLIGRELFSETK